MPKPERWPVPQRKFSQLVRGLAIEMDRDPTVYADTNHVQWTADSRWGNYNLLGAYTAIPGAGETATAGAASPSGATPLDGFTITRTGDVPIGLRVTLNINHIPERIKLSPALAPILGIQEDIKANILGAFWHYVKANGLQDKNDRKLIRLDERLKGVFKYVVRICLIPLFPNLRSPQI
jgi:SWI/SNF-related matrix-associated actin-dependent regulator of chromatin subfamily D